VVMLAEFRNRVDVGLLTTRRDFTAARLFNSCDFRAELQECSYCQVIFRGIKMFVSGS
jgi:hypothetical protein